MEPRKDNEQEKDVNKLLEERLREERTVKLSVACPMCMTIMSMEVEIGNSHVFFGNTSCPKCGRAYSVHGNRTVEITRIIPKWEEPCTDLQTRMSLGT